ncbi:MAG: LURP-one-related family protein [Candidatus Bathyarchaeia archaeon]
MYCQICGAEISPTDKYCPSCGAAQQAPAQPQQQPYPTPQPQAQPQPQTNTQQTGMFNQNKYTIEQKLVAVRDTYGVKDLNGNLLGYVKQKIVSVGPKFWFEDTNGVQLGEVDGKLVSIHDEYDVKDQSGQLKARIKKKILNLIGSEWWMEDAQGQQIAKVKGNYSEHEYQILAPDGSVIAQIHKKWVTIRDSYNIEITRSDFDAFLIISYVIAMDHIEQKNNPAQNRIGPFSF